MASTFNFDTQTLRRHTFKGVALAFLITLAFASSAQAQAPVGLGTSKSFGVLGGSAVTNTGPTVVNGDLGVSPNNAVSGFPPGTVNGTIHAGDAVAAQAQSDLTTAYNSAAGRACNTTLTGQDLGGLTLTSGVYCFGSSAQLTGPLTLDAQGDPNAVFIFQIGSTLTTASNSSVNLINGAQACNVFWQVGSSATLGTTTAFVGNVLALTSITANTGATVDGRLLARNGAVTLDNNTITKATCAAGPGGGADGGGGGTDGGDTGPGGTGPGGGGGTGGGGGGGGATDDDAPIIDIPDNWITDDGDSDDSDDGGDEGDDEKKRCLAKEFKLRVRARDASGIRVIKVLLDGKLIARTSRKQLGVKISAKGLSAGRHTIRVIARDRVGNKRVVTKRFKRCDRPEFPAFADSPNFTG